MITLKSSEEIKILKEGGRILARVLNEVAKEAKPGVSTAFLNKVARDLILSLGGEPAFEGYRPTGATRPYPCALCVSLNEVVVHGVPSKKIILKEGDILKLDLGVKYKDFFTDAALTVGVGGIDEGKKHLIEVTKKALNSGMAQVKAGGHVGDIGAAIADFVEGEGFAVIEDLVGHGVGYEVHEDPSIPNFGKRGAGPVLKQGMVLAIEPMVSMGSAQVRLGRDGFNYETADGSFSAHFEHTVAVTEGGYLILTE